MNASTPTRPKCCPRCGPIPTDAPMGICPSCAIKPPECLGEYELLTEIGRGGMAVVYEAYQPSLDRFVAIKTILDRSFTERFRKEPLIVGKLEHDNIVPIYEIGPVDGQPYFVMKLFAR